MEEVNKPRQLDADEKAREIARGNVEQHLGDCFGEDGNDEPSADAIYDEAYTLGFDALHDAGYDDDYSRKIAREVAQAIAQP